MPLHLLLATGVLALLTLVPGRLAALLAASPRVRRTLDRVTGAALVAFATRLATEHG